MSFTRTVILSRVLCSTLNLDYRGEKDSDDHGTVSVSLKTIPSLGGSSIGGSSIVGPFDGEENEPSCSTFIHREWDNSKILS